MPIHSNPQPFLPSGVDVPKPAEPGEHAAEHATDVATAPAADVPADVPARRQPAGTDLRAQQPGHQLSPQLEC